MESKFIQCHYERVPKAADLFYLFVPILEMKHKVKI